jgi:membrane protease YdiL (CAAX protease family)
LFIWLPLEFDLLPGGKWNIADVIEISTTVLGAIPIIFYYYLFIYSEDNLGFGFRINRQDIIILCYSIIFLFLILIPLGFYLNFLGIRLDVDPWYLFFMKIILFMIFVAYPEELLFRSVLIVILRENTSLKIFSILIISSVIFGSAHILNPTSGISPPNWSYFLMASIAGWFYGWVYLKTGKVFTAVILHAFVDSVWVHFFMA